MLLKKRFIDNNTVYIRTGRQPVDHTVIIGIIFQIGTIKSRRQLRVSQIVQKVFNKNRVFQRKPTYRQDIRQIIMVVTIAVKICGVGSQSKFKFYIRESITQVLGIVFQKLSSPQSNSYLFLFFSSTCCLVSTSTQHGHSQNQYQQCAEKFFHLQYFPLFPTVHLLS